MSTGIGFGLAIPHVRLASIKNICMAAAVVRNGVSDYETIDNEKVKLIFMIIAGENQHSSHLKLLSQLSAKLKNPLRRARLCDVKDNFHFYEILNSDI
ncbi:MAG: PTS sugar transporter subunit IIA, partial [Victivallaceae bacterium]